MTTGRWGTNSNAFVFTCCTTKKWLIEGHNSGIMLVQSNLFLKVVPSCNLGALTQEEKVFFVDMMYFYISFHYVVIYSQCIQCRDARANVGSESGHCNSRNGHIFMVIYSWSYIQQFPIFHICTFCLPKSRATSFQTKQFLLPTCIFLLDFFLHFITQFIFIILCFFSLLQMAICLKYLHLFIPNIRIYNLECCPLLQKPHLEG